MLDFKDRTVDLGQAFTVSQASVRDDASELGHVFLQRDRLSLYPELRYKQAATLDVNSRNNPLTFAEQLSASKTCASKTSAS
jgi:hypothetical protein